MVSMQQSNAEQLYFLFTIHLSISLCFLLFVDMVVAVCSSDFFFILFHCCYWLWLLWVRLHTIQPHIYIREEVYVTLGFASISSSVSSIFSGWIGYSTSAKYVTMSKRVVLWVLGGEWRYVPWLGFVFLSHFLAPCCCCRLWGVGGNRPGNRRSNMWHVSE